MLHSVASALVVLLTVCGSFAASGCGGKPRSASEAAYTTVAAGAAPPAPGAAEAAADHKPAAPNPAGEAFPVHSAERKIIYTGTLNIIVADLDAARARVTQLLTTHKGYIAKSEVRNDTGTRRTATYTLRVPVDEFWKVTDGLLALGTPERNAADSQDVTEEYIDVQARIKNLKSEEEVLNKLLKESGSRDEVLRTREQIRIIRGDIERAQARLDYLSKLSALSTINLTLQEIRDYKPPTAPTFREQVNRTFADSWESFVAFTEGVALFAVGLTPWLPIVIPVALLVLWLLRKVTRMINEVNAPQPLAGRRLRSVSQPVEPPTPPARESGSAPAEPPPA